MSIAVAVQFTITHFKIVNFYVYCLKGTAQNLLPTKIIGVIYDKITVPVLKSLVSYMIK